MATPGRNDPCWCASGRKYKHCHARVDGAVGPDRYIASQEAYATNWRSTAEQHADDGVYAWLAEQISSYPIKRVLDVGCGSGHGLVALREAFRRNLRIVALDENRECLRTSEATLRAKGIDDVGLLTRMEVHALPGGFAHICNPLPRALPSGIALVESDVCNDPYLVGALASDGLFDAVTVWLTGVHMVRQQNIEVLRAGVDTDGGHRLYVQNHVYELADRILRPGGVLQVADRGEAPTSDLLRDDVLRAHADQASVTSLQVQGLTHRPYRPPIGRRSPLRPTPALSGRTPGTDIAVVSIVSTKP